MAELDLTFLSPEEKQAIKDGNFGQISKESSIKLQHLASQYSKGTEEEGTYQAYIDAPLSQFEDVKKTGDSPLSFFDRMRLGTGNRKGKLSYLRGKGIDAVYRGDDLYIKQDDGSLVPADPSFFDPTGDSVVPKDLKSILQRDVSRLKDLPSDVGEFLADAPAMLLEEGGQAAGAALGGASPVPGGSFLGRLLGSALGSGGGEMIRQYAGKKLGTYEPESDDLINQDVESAAVIGGVASFLPALLRGKRQVQKKTAETALKKKIPQRWYASATNMGDELVKSPQMIDELMDSGIFGTRDQIKKKALDLGLNEKELLENILSTMDDVQLDDVMTIFRSKVGSVGSGDVKKQKRAIKEVLGDFQEKDIWKTKKVSTPAGKQGAVDIPDDEYLQNVYKKQYPKEHINLEMAPHRTQVSVPRKKPSYEEFKNAIISESPDSPPSENIIRELYNEEVPSKIINRVYPAPKGKFAAPSYEEWKDEYLQSYMKKSRKPDMLTSDKKFASATDINEEKKLLQGAASDKFGKSTSDQTVKEVQKTLSQSIRESIENASGDPEKIAKINQNIHKYFSLLENLGLVDDKALKQPLLSGTEGIIGAVSPATLAKKIALDKAQKSTAVGTTGSVLLKQLMGKWEKLPIDRTQKQQLFEIIGAQLLRELRE